MKKILTDKNGKVLAIGQTINVPEPDHSLDIHNNEFTGQLDSFRGENVVVRDGDDEYVEIEPHRVEIDEDSEVTFTPEDVESFKKEWGQSTGEVTSNLGYDEEGSDDLLMVDYFWLEETQQWYPIISTMYTIEQQAVANYLRF